MAHSNQAKKRIRQNDKRRLRNKARASRMRTEIKKFEDLVQNGDKAGAAAQLPFVVKMVDKAAKSHVIHANAAARKKGQLMRAVQAMGA